MRQFPNFFEITAGSFIALGIRYGLFAGLAWVLGYVLFKRRWLHRKVIAHFPATPEVRREIAYSAMSLVIFGLTGAVTVQFARMGWTQLYWRISDHGWPWFWLSIGATILLHDTWFYWTHRLVHYPRLFRYFHRVHHLSHNPSPWAAYAFDPLEAVVQSAIFPLAAIVMPLHPFAFALFMGWQITYNVLGHTGYEFHPRWLMDSWLGRILNTPTNHIMHHEKLRGNYGLYFNVWDRLMGTNHKDYEARFREVTSRSKNMRTLGSAQLAAGLVLVASNVFTKRATLPALERIVVSSDGKGFVTAGSNTPFIPWGVNYGNHGRLMEDFWDKDWETLASDFREIRKLGANVVRVHLQFGSFMKAPGQPNEANLALLGKLLELAEPTGIYLDVTGLACYRPADTPPWYDTLSDAERREVQATFWRAVGERCATSPTVFCYDLMNEPISPGPSNKWYSGALLGGYDFIQNIARNSDGRPRNEVALTWIQKLTSAIRAKDPSRLITVGMLPWSTKWKHLSGFIPSEVAPHVDFLSVHIYPNATHPEEASRALRECQVGKPVVIEETFPLTCTVAELEAFLRSSRATASGWIWHYDGIPVDKYSELEKDEKLTAAQSVWLNALRSFARLEPEFRPVQVQPNQTPSAR